MSLLSFIFGQKQKKFNPSVEFEKIKPVEIPEFNMLYYGYPYHDSGGLGTGWVLCCRCPRQSLSAHETRYHTKYGDVAGTECDHKLDYKRKYCGAGLVITDTTTTAKVYQDRDGVKCADYGEQPIIEHMKRSADRWREHNENAKS